MTFRIEDLQFHVLPMRTRFPFKYGIASMSALPHLFVTAHLVVNDRQVRGLASEGLPPKWFTKEPDTLFEQDLAEMLAVISNAARIAENAANQPVGFFTWWRDLYDEQSRWALHKDVPMLLANLGTSLIERAVLDALCRAAGKPLHEMLPSAALGIDLGGVRGSLAGMRVADALATAPVQQVHARHTVGLGDPLRTADIPENERLHDGLPHSLEDSIRAYGLRWFKIKVSGKLDNDLPRLRAIAAVLLENCGGDFRCTFDGNEQFYDLESFREFYRSLAEDPAARPVFARLALIEQPLHRSHTLKNSIAGWEDGPPVIIDESDGSLDDLPRAIELGYAGTSHKNCKGIVKSIANAALLKKHGLTHLSGEDLAGVGPVAMPKDLAVAAALGITHVERNGHHYFRGLSMYPSEIQEAALAAHPGFYERHADGFPVLRIRDGLIDATTVNAAPFGCAADIDATCFEPLNEWIKRGGMAEL